MSSDPHSPLRVIGLQLLLALALLTLVSLAVTSSSAVCRSCHAMRPYAEAQASGRHAGVSCYACHLSQGLWGLPGQKAREFLGMYPAALLGKGMAGPSTPVSASACLGCHAEILEVPSLKGVTRIRHASCAPGATCDACHASIPHGKAVRWTSSADMASCIACHRDESASVECDGCHTGRSRGERLATGPWRITHGKSWRQAHGMGDIRYCDACHPKDYCVRCHGTALPHPEDFLTSHGKESQRKTAKCLTCHERAFCDDCHRIRMPHPASFERQHITTTKGLADPTCTKCHRKDDCTRCHAAHAHPGKTDGTLGGAPLPEAQGVAR